MRAVYSWPIRWKTRSEPVRSTWTRIPGYFVSKFFATASVSGRSAAL
jgi:hypothetical protein